MALNFASMLLQPTPVQPWDLGGGEASLARQQLKLAREKFAFEQSEAKKQHEYEQQRLKAEEARAAAAAEKERLDREAQAQAQLLEKQQGAVQKFGELAGSGKVEAAQAMVPYLDQLGYSAQDLGGVGGLPVYELTNRAQQAEEQQATEAARAAGDEMAGLGYPTDERGTMEPPAGIASSDQLDSSGRSVADRVAATYGTPGAKLPTAAPDEEDYTGAVRRNVIDLPAQQAATLARLRPMLGAIQESYPTDYQASAGKTGEAVMQSGLPLPEGLALFKDLRQSPDELIKAGIQANAQKEQFREKRDAFTPKDIENFKKSGWAEAENTAVKGKIPDAAAGYALGDTVLDLLDDDSGANDTMIAGALMDMQAIKGIPSDRDMEMAFGTGKQSFIDQVFGAVESAAKGGFSTVQREALRSFVKRTQQNLRDRVFNYLDTANNPGESYNEYVKAGYADKARALINDAGLLAEYDEERAKKKPAGGKSAELSSTSGKKFDPNPTTGDFDIELEAQAMENDLDPEKIKRVMGPESGGRANARNPASGATGLIQFMPSVAEALGTSTEELSKMSAADQLPFVMKYLSDRGVTADSPAEDYVMAVAAPAFIGKPAETVVYPKGSKAWEQNPAWRPKDGGDITVGSIQAFYGGGSKGAEAPKAELPEPTTDAERRIQEMMRRQQGGR